MPQKLVNDIPSLSTYTDTDDCIILCCIVSLIIVSNLMMAKSEAAEICSWYGMYNCKCSCVLTAMAVYNFSFISFLGSRYKNRHYELYLCMVQKTFDPSWISCGHSHVFLACQLLIFFISVWYSFCHTPNTLWVARRIKKIIKIGKHEIYKKKCYGGYFTAWKLWRCRG